MACFAKMWLMWGWQEGEAKLILVSLISNTAPSKKPSCSKVSPDVNLLIAWFPSPPLIHWSNLSSDLYKKKKKFVFSSAVEIPMLVLCLLLSEAYGLILDKMEEVGICLLPGEKFFASLPGKTSDPVVMIFLLIGMQRSYLFITSLLLITTPLAHSPQMSSLYTTREAVHFFSFLALIICLTAELCRSGSYIPSCEADSFSNACSVSASL